MDEVEKYLDTFLEDEYQNTIAARLTKYSDEEIEERADKFYEKYLGPGISYMEIQRPYKPSKQFFFQDDPTYIATHLRKRTLVALKEATIQKTKYYLAYLTYTYVVDGPASAELLYIIDAESKQIVAIYAISLDPSPHWWHAQGEELKLSEFKVTAEKMLTSDIAEDAKEYVANGFLKVEVKS